MTKVRDVYQAIVALSTEGVCDADQRQIMQLANISRRHLQRILHELDELDLIRTERHYHFRQRKTKNRYFILGRPDSRSPVAPEAMGHQESHRSGGNGTPGVPSVKSDGPSGVPLGGAMGHQESHWGAMGLLESPMHDSCMLHGEVEQKNWVLLDFLNEPERSLRASECAPDLVQAWRELKDFRDQNDLWELLSFVNPAGWINTELRAGRRPPPLQIPLPGGAVDLSSEFKSRGMTREEIQSHLSPGDGATLGEDGVWR